MLNLFPFFQNKRIDLDRKEGMMVNDAFSVTVNDKEIKLFRGATLKHALLKADETLYQLVLKGEAEIRDQEGNVVLLGGSVANGWSYYVKRK
jgi:hypothetical protein